MYKAASLFTLALLAASPVLAADICKGDVPEEVVLAERYQYKVAGTGRLHLHTGPSEKCINKKVFVIPGDDLVAFTEAGENGEWTSVMYMAKNGDDYSGWVRTERLRFMGAMGGNISPETIRFYQKAARAAADGKLGSPTAAAH